MIGSGRTPRHTIAQSGNEGLPIFFGGAYG
jgi:hypothetical protein